MKSEYLKFEGYWTIGFNPNREDFIICTFYLEPNRGVKFKEAAIGVAAESSIGTWTEVKTLSSKIRKKLAARVFYFNPANKIIKIAYPLELFEPGNIPQFLSNCAGNIFSVKIIKNLRLIDVEFPTNYINSFPGPAYGIDGIRKLVRIKNRPLIGSIVKPKLGLSAQEHARCAYECFLGGIDLVKDDENLTNQSFNQFTERAVKTLKMAKLAEKKTGEKKICALNITAPFNEMIRRAKFIKKHGGNCIMVDVVTVGFSALQSLRKLNLGLFIYAHRAMHSAFTRNENHGISFLVLAKLLRLAGVDLLHAGTVIGKMEGTKKPVLEVYKFLRAPWGNLKPVLPAASGGLHPGLIPELIQLLGTDFSMNFGGGVHGHPGGTLKGAKAARQALEAVLKKSSLKEYAQDHLELQEILKYWGKRKFV
jgi:ribulose-bisphosphate carboxylase large chain